jgi:hypothetical protein
VTIRVVIAEDEAIIRLDLKEPDNDSNNNTGGKHQEPELGCEGAEKDP